MTSTTLSVVGTGLALAGAGSPGELLTGSPDGATPYDVVGHLGKKGLRYKDRATHLGLSVALSALRDSGLLGEGDELTVNRDDVAVVVGSNLGNLDTVAKVVQTIADEDGSGGISPMDTPNASSNEVAAAVAIRFGLRGPNMSICNGSASGVDALRWGARLLTAHRARHVLVIGVEPDNDVVRRLVGGRRVIDGAAAVVLELAGTARDRQARERARVAAFARTAGVAACVHRLADAVGGSRPVEWFTPEGTAVPTDPAPVAGLPRHDLGGRWGFSSAALGVLQCVAAVSRFEAGLAGTVFAVAGADDDDASAGMVLTSPRLGS